MGSSTGPFLFLFPTLKGKKSTLRSLERARAARWEEWSNDVKLFVLFYFFRGIYSGDTNLPFCPLYHYTNTLVLYNSFCYASGVHHLEQQNQKFFFGWDTTKDGVPKNPNGSNAATQFFFVPDMLFV